MSRKTHKTAVVIIPPHGVWKPIQDIRCRYDRHFRRWMPHINLIYPFRRREEFDLLEKEFLNVCGKIKPFDIKLEKINYFHHGGGNFTLWLKPEPSEPIVELQTNLWQIVPDCDDVRRYGSGFTPHLSIGQVKGWDRMLNLVKMLQDRWRSISFTVDEIYFIFRGEPPDDIFRVDRGIKLGDFVN